MQMIARAVKASWNGEQPPYVRDRCEGVCGEGLHYHVAWAGLIAHVLILLTVIAIITCLVV